MKDVPNYIVRVLVEFSSFLLFGVRGKRKTVLDGLLFLIKLARSS